VSVIKSLFGKVAEYLNNPVPVVKIMWLESTTGLMFKLGRRYRYKGRMINRLRFIRIGSNPVLATKKCLKYVRNKMH